MLTNLGVINCNNLNTVRQEEGGDRYFFRLCYVLDNILRPHSELIYFKDPTKTRDNLRLEEQFLPCNHLQ